MNNEEGLRDGRKIPDEVMGYIRKIASNSHFDLYRQADKGEQALTQMFSPPPSAEKVLFYLPVTKAWLQQGVLAVVLLCHSSFRGVIEFFGTVLDCPLALGSVPNIEP